MKLSKHGLYIKIYSYDIYRFYIYYIYNILFKQITLQIAV